MSQHPNVTLLIEPFSMHCPAIFDRRGEYWTAADYDPARGHRRVRFPSGVRTFLHEFRDEGLVPAAPGDRRVFKETFLFMQLGWLRRYVPDLRVIYLSRDPAEVAASFVRHGLYRKWRYREYFAAVDRSIRHEPDLARYRTLTAAVDPADVVEVVTALRLISGAEWERHRTAFDHVSARFDDVRDDPDAALRRIWTFLDVPPATPAPPAPRSRPRGDMYSRYPRRNAGQPLSIRRRRRIAELEGLL